MPALKCAGIFTTINQIIRKPGSVQGLPGPVRPVKIPGPATYHLFLLVKLPYR